MKASKIIMLLMVIAILTPAAHAQTSGNNSPYSRYGWGTLSDESQSFNKGMGGIALGMRGSKLLNRQNPASYAVIDSLTMLFDIGATLQLGRMKCGDASVSPKNSTFDYASVAFRLFKGLGFSLGIRPYTTIGYNFASSQTLDDIDGYGEKKSTATYLGEGGVHQVYGGLGWGPAKNFSIGVNVGALWGDYSHSVSVAFSDASIQSLYRYYSATLGTWTVDLGMQYVHKLSRKDRLTLGATMGIGHEMNQMAKFINMKYNSSTLVGSDTIHAHNAFELPWNFGAGLVYNHGGKWVVGFDYTTQIWSKCRFPQLMTQDNKEIYQPTTSCFSNRQRFALGAQYMKNPEGFKFSDKIAYRMGASYTTSYFKMDGENGPKSYMATVGIALPFINQNMEERSILNVAVQYEHLEPSIRGQIKEDYLRFSLGLMFNATWFNKWKFR